MRYIIYSRGDSVSEHLKDQIINHMNKDDRWRLDPDHPELVICIGGDGTILRAIHHYLSIIDSVGFVAIHTGTLGFFTDYTKAELERFLDDIQKPPFGIQECELLECLYEMDGRQHRLLALNEFRIGTFANSCRFDIFIDGEYFETANGCGVCVSSQAGSTGANKSLGGAVIDDGLSLIQLCEIMPVSHKNHHSLNSPYIMRSDRQILLIPKNRDTRFHIAYDHLCETVDDVSRIIIRSSKKTVRFIRFRPYSYLKRLKNLY